LGVWERTNKEFFDPHFNGVNWMRVREAYRAQAEAADDRFQLYGVLNKMLSELGSSHVEVYLDRYYGPNFTGGPD